MRRPLFCLLPARASLILAPAASAAALELDQWMKSKRITLDLSSRACFNAMLPSAPNRLRIAMSVNQAGAGYLGAFSREITYRR